MSRAVQQAKVESMMPQQSLCSDSKSSNWQSSGDLVHAIKVIKSLLILQLSGELILAAFANARIMQASLAVGRYNHGVLQMVTNDWILIRLEQGKNANSKCIVSQP